MERLIVSFEYDAADVTPDELQHILKQLQERIVPRPRLVYAALGPTADELHAILTGHQPPDPRGGTNA